MTARRIRITWPSGSVTAVLEATVTSEKLVAALPCESTASTWGHEVYFSMPVKVKLEADARQVVEPGTDCFWVQGSSLARPFGPSPASQADEGRLVTDVNVLGKIEGDPKVLKGVRDGQRIRVELAG